jgi:alpha-tubulin suppressor-like RCC1 family protein
MRVTRRVFVVEYVVKSYAGQVGPSVENSSRWRFSYLFGIVLLLGGVGAGKAVTPMVSMGDAHGLALRADGTVLAWGSDTYGQLGVGRPLISTAPVKVPGLSNVRSIAGGSSHSLGVRQDGTVWAWGANEYGQLGDGTTTARSSPIQVPGVTNAVMACAGGWHSAALKQDGTVWAWGNNWNGQVGNGTTSTSSQPGPVTGLTGATSIACYGNQTLALLQDGTMRAWGANRQGELGDGTTIDRWLPVQVSGLDNVVAINGTAALRRDGTVWEWGFNSCCGQTTPNLVPTQSPGVNSAALLSLSYGGSFGGRLGAVRSDGVTWWEWQAGATPSAQATVGTIRAVASSPFFTLLLKGDGTVVSSGLNNSGQLGNGITPTGGWNWQADFLPVVGLNNVTAVAAGDSHSLAIDVNGNVWAWGDDAYGQLGRGATLAVTVPTVVPGLSNIVQVSAAGAGTSLALDSSGNVWAWGLNYHGQLGDGTNANRSSPVLLTAVQNVKMVAKSSTWTSMVLKQDGTVWAWGNNFFGQLANGTTGNYSTSPAQVPGLTNVAAISAHTYHMLAVKQDGTVWAWGDNGNGQLGLGTTTASLVPTQIPTLSGVKSVTATWARSFAVNTDGTVMGWGSGAWGALGDGTWGDFNQLTPKLVPGVTSVVELSASSHTLVRRSDGSIWGWGQTWGGSELGKNPPSSTPGPVTGLGPMAGIATGQQTSVLLGADGLVYTGGANATGQLGDGTFAQHADFVLAVASGLTGYLDLSTGTTANVSDALRVPFFVSAKGGISSNSAVVKTTTKFNSAEMGKSGSVYVTAMIPAASAGMVKSVASIDYATSGKEIEVANSSFVMLQLTATGWQQVFNGQLVPYASGVLGDQLAAQTILDGADTTNLKGAQYCLGYGTSAEEMIATGRMRTVATIPTDSGATYTVPASCIVETGGTATNGFPVYRFFNNGAGGHFYTINAAEKDTVIANYNWFRYEGVGFNASPVAQAGLLPVYRFFNNNAGGHFYTISESEKNTVLQNYNWFRYEGTGFHASTERQPGMLPVYRFFNTNAGGHFYTINEAEKNTVIQNYNWFRYEGVGFYAYPAQ